MGLAGGDRLFLRLKALMVRCEAGWEVVRDGTANFFKNGDLNQAAAIALYALLSIIPLFILSVLAAGWFLGSNVDIQRQITAVIRTFHPYFDGNLLSQLGQIESKGHVLGGIGMISLIWFSSMIFGAMDTALNIIFRSGRRRNVLLSKLFAFSMIPAGWTVGLTSVLLTYVATLLSNQTVFGHAPFLKLHLLTRAVLQYVIPFLAAALFTTIVFLVIPSKRIRFTTALAGSCLFSLLTELVKHAFTWYVAHHTRYNAIFGSLETVVILLVWVYYMAVIFLFCAELMSSYERRDLLLIEHVLLSRTSHTGSQRMFRKFGRCYPAGSVICEEGDLGQDMFFILDGKVRLEMKGGPRVKVLAEMGPGSYFGEMAALTGAPRTATAVAQEDSEIAVIDGDLFHRLVRESDDLAIHLLKEFSARISHTNAALEARSGAWARLRILLSLLRRSTGSAATVADLSERLGEDKRDVLILMQELSSEGGVILDGETLQQVDEATVWRAIQRLTDTRIEV